MILTKPLIFLDTETTGTDIQRDRIVQIGLYIVEPDGRTSTVNQLINPGMPISYEAMQIHGITDDMVKGKSKFKEIAPDLFNIFSGCDLAGYNIDRFDVPLLQEEFARVDIDFPEEGTKTIDVLKLERIFNSHKLAATYKRYTGKDLDAHDALNDAKAATSILLHQLIEKPKITIDEIRDIYSDKNCRHLDFAGKVVEINGVACWGEFSKKYKWQPIDTDPQYLDWVMRSDFPAGTKRTLKKLTDKN